MSTILSVLNGPTPAQIRAGSQSEQNLLQGSPASGIELLAQRISNIESPIGQEFVRGFLQRRFNINVPTLEELELDRQRTLRVTKQLHEEQRSFLVRKLVGFFVDNAGRPADEALSELGAQMGVLPRGQIPSGQNLSDFFRDAGLPGELDIGLLERPEELRAASQAVAQIFGNPDLALSTEDLLAFPLTQKAASLTPEARAAEETRDEARTLEAANTVAKEMQEFSTGKERGQGGVVREDPLRKMYEQSFDAAEAQHEKMFGAGVDVDPSGFDDLEEIGGAQTYAEGLQSAMQAASAIGVRPETFVRMALTEDRGQRIGEILRDRISLDEQGIAAPTDDVSNFYLTVISELAQRGGMRPEKALSLMGLSDAGIRGIAPGGLRGSVEAGSE